MNAKEFKEKTEKLIYEIEGLIEEMPYKADSETDSQKIFLMNQLNQFNYAVNGVTDDDFNEE
jgi:hypothetical protein